MGASADPTICSGDELSFRVVPKEASRLCLETSAFGAGYPPPQEVGCNLGRATSLTENHSWKDVDLLTFLVFYYLMEHKYLFDLRFPFHLNLCFLLENAGGEEGNQN